MRRHEDDLIDPEIEACLDAIDATLAGEPVDPRFAEVAELALLVAAERPSAREGFGRELDARVARRFAATDAVMPVKPRAAGRVSRLWMGAGGFAAACAAAVIAVVALSSSSKPATHLIARSIALAPQTAKAPSGPNTAATASSAGGTATSTSASSVASGRPTPAATPDAVRSFAPSNLAATAAGQALQLPANGRSVVQSAEVDLATTPGDIDAVAQEVLDAVGTAGGIVDNSNVTQTGGIDGSATFDLRIPSSALSRTLSRLSELRGAQVISRTDASHDINSQYVSATRALADARALRAALLRQLAAALTTAQIDSLKARIHDAESAIASDEAQVASLNSQVSYSHVTVNVSSRQTPVPAKHSSGGFTLHRAAHIAGRVLVVSAAVALVALAVLAPLSLLAALIAWGGATARRRRRERALDLA